MGPNYEPENEDSDVSVDLDSNTSLACYLMDGLGRGVGERA